MDHAFSQSQLGSGRGFRLLNPDVLTSIETVAGRYGGRAVKVYPHNNSSAKGVGVVLSAPIGVANTAYGGAAVRIDVIDEEVIFGFTQGGFQKIAVGVNSGGFWYIYDVTGGSVLAQSPSKFAVVGRWYYLELEFFANSSSGFANLYVNGELAVSYSGSTTNDLGDIGELFFGSTRGSGAANITTHTFDDVYVCDSTGSVNNSRRGDCRVELLRPSATVVNNFDLVGSSPAATAHASVRDASGVDSDITAISSNTTAERATFTSDDTLSEVPRNIYGVGLLHVTRKTGAGAPTIKGVVISDASESVGSAAPTYDAYTADRHLVELDPDGAIAWTRTAVEAATFGVEIG